MSCNCAPPTWRCPPTAPGIAHERAVLHAALSKVSTTLGGTGAAATIAEAHRALLTDPELAATADRHIGEGRSAAFAWRAALADARDALRATGDALLMERVSDLIDLERQVIAALLGGASATPPALRPDTILIAEDLLPSQFLALDRVGLAGICTAAGGPTSHVAILAASAGVPMLVAAGADVLARGWDPRHSRRGRRRPRRRSAARRPSPPPARASRTPAPAAPPTSPPRTSFATRRMARRIEVFANLGSREDAASAVSAGAEGCGLLRTEFLFLDRDTALRRRSSARPAPASPPPWATGR